MNNKKKGSAGQGRTPRKKSSTSKGTPVRVARQAHDQKKGREELLGMALKEKVELIRELVQRVDCREVELRFEIGMHCRDVIEKTSNFGDRAVVRLADALGWSQSNIYDHAKVARAWKSKAEAVAAAQTMNRGWRHLVEIATAPAEKRLELITAVRDDGLSVRALQRHKKKIAPASPRTKPSTSLGDTTPSISLTEALQDLAVDVTQFENFGVPHADRLADVGGRADPADITPEFAKHLAALRRRVDAIHKKTIQALDACPAAGEQDNSKRKDTKETPTDAKVKSTKSTAKPKTKEPVVAGRNAEVASPA